jgi:glycine cleavage system aminomethyltransferase T
VAETLALSHLLRQAGAVMTYRGAQPVPAHYGSAPGELAVCVQSVGLAHRADLAVLSVTGSNRTLNRLMERGVGHSIADGGAAFEDGAWWCCSTSNTALTLVCRRPSLECLIRSLRYSVTGRNWPDVLNQSDQHLIFSVIGRRTEAVLADLGVFGPSRDPRASTPFAQAPVRGHDVAWLLESSTAALAIVELNYGAAVWQAIDEAGRPHGISCVGVDAIERYALLERSARRCMTIL